MFQKKLSAIFKRVFDLEKVTYDLPGDSEEQECAFIEIIASKCKVVDAKELARVNGKLHVFAPSSKLPHGYFAKKIADAKTEDVRHLFFFDFEENAGQFGNIVERSLSFVYLYDNQYDPALGAISSIDLSLSIAENT